MPDPTAAPSSGEERWQKPPMVDWYAPGQLARTGVQTVLSTALGSMIDTRRLSTIQSADEKPLPDYSQGVELWFDYMADTGDGWDGTYTMAYLLSLPALAVGGSTLPRGRFLVLGGDEVYPVASRDTYARPRVWPFNQAARALKHASPASDVYCTPGNHDWYDSLAAFTRRFCSGRRLGSFQTRQRRSYFALDLPHRWHLWGIDIQLGHDIDVDQWSFFAGRAPALGPEDRVIVCSAEPETVYGRLCDEDLRFTLRRIVELVEKSGARVAVHLAGDTHNYQRYTGDRDPRKDLPPGTNPGRRPTTYPQTKLVAGGGGAFLHPTHTFDDGPSDASGEFTCKSRYPEAAASAALSWSGLLFAFKSWKMSLLLALVYVMLFWTSAALPDSWATYPLEHPGSVLLMLSLVGGLVAFADAKGWKKLLWGGLHGVAHVAAAALAFRLGGRLAEPAAAVAASAGERELRGAPIDLLAEAYLPRVAAFGLGWLLAGTIFGLYLVLSLNLWKIHRNEAFSALRIGGYKHFLRFHVTPEGSLEAYAVGVDEVAGEEAEHPVPVRLIERFEVAS